MKSTQFRIIFVRTTAAERFPSIAECVSCESDESRLCPYVVLPTVGFA